MINENFLGYEMKTVYIYTTRIISSVKDSSNSGPKNHLSLPLDYSST